MTGIMIETEKEITKCPQCESGDYKFVDTFPYSGSKSEDGYSYDNFNVYNCNNCGGRFYSKLFKL